jgi:WD40 repeat protein
MRKILRFSLAILFLSGVISIGTAYAQRDCPRSRLIPAQKGQVTAGTSNRMRDEPSTSARVIKTIPGNSIFLFNGATTCVEGYLWVNIIYDNNVGWTVEAQGSNYFVEPVAPPDGAIVIPASILDVAWSSDGDTIVLGTNSGVYTVNTTLATPIPQLLTQGRVDDVEFNPTVPDMLAISAGYGMVQVWDIKAKKVLYENITGDPNGLSIDYNVVGDLQFSSDGQLLFAVASQTLETYDTSTWKTVGVIQNEKVMTAAMSPDGQQVAIIPWSPDKPYIIDWSGNQIPLDTGGLSDVINAIHFSPDNKMLAMSDNQGHMLNQILATGEQYTYSATFDDDYHFIGGLSFSLDSSLLAIGDYTADGGVMHLMNATTLEPIGTVMPDRVNKANQIAFSPDGSQIACVFDNVVLILNTADIQG